MLDFGEHPAQLFPAVTVTAARPIHLASTCCGHGRGSDLCPRPWCLAALSSLSSWGMPVSRDSLSSRVQA